MMTFIYFLELERLAVDWVARCKYEHPDPKIYPQYSGIGQNLGITPEPLPGLTYPTHVWADEFFDYNFSNNLCKRVCGHYTQMVWATSTEVGCAIKLCDNVYPATYSPVHFLVCHYKPWGNIPGEKPYRAGNFCTECPPESTCHRRQCVKT
uniref:SCP domain-containing protein n=1 Tax=Mesocestoides corti TaxID=53468 RepID=A0A5K3FQ23_MESCO